MTLIFSIVGTAIALAMLSRRLPAQNILSMAVLVILTSGLMELAATRFSFPYRSTRALSENEIAMALSWAAPLLWLATTLLAREFMRFTFRPMKGTVVYAGGTILVSSLFVTAVWFFIAPDTQRGHLPDLTGRLITAILLQLLISPWLIDKRTLYASRT